MKKEIFVWEQENKNRIVAGLKISAFPAFFWNCNQSYSLVFDFKLIEKERPCCIGLARPEPENKEDGLEFYLSLDFYQAKIDEYDNFYKI